MGYYHDACWVRILESHEKTECYNMFISNKFYAKSENLFTRISAQEYNVFIQRYENK